VLSELLALPRDEEQEYLFSTTGTTPVSGFPKAKKRLDGLTGVSGWRNHDLRRSFATYATQDLGALPVVVGKILNHQSGSVRGIDAVYQRGEYLDERRTTLNDWGNFVVDL